MPLIVGTARVRLLVRLLHLDSEGNREVDPNDDRFPGGQRREKCRGGAIDVT